MKNNKQAEEKEDLMKQLLIALKKLDNITSELEDNIKKNNNL